VALEVEVDEAGGGARLDVFLVRAVDGLSRTRARRMIQDGRVHLNGRPARKGVRVTAGDVVRLASVPPPADFVPRPGDPEALRVVHEDAQLVVVDKPAGLPSHPLRPDEVHTLANQLIARYPEMEGVGYAAREPGILHRLDNDTSGLLVAARDAPTFEALRAALKAGAIDKGYEVVVDGRLEREDPVIDGPIANHPSDPRRVHVCLGPTDRRRGAAREACTEIVSTRALSDAYTHVRVRVSRAVRHQIRAHFAALGHPLVGDWLYGGSDGLDRHFLHAWSIAFDHPATDARVEVEAPLPPELAAFVEAASR